MVTSIYAIAAIDLLSFVMWSTVGRFLMDFILIGGGSVSIEIDQVFSSFSKASEVLAIKVDLSVLSLLLKSIDGIHLAFVQVGGVGISAPIMIR